MVSIIYISWRKKIGEKRYIIAKIKRNVNGISFDYTKEFQEAKKDGLEHFLGFKDAETLTTKKIETLLSLRIISKDRPDRPEFLQFWEAENVADTFDILAFTQGKSPSDNFEFLADFLTVKTDKLIFVTDLAGISHLKINAGTVKIGDMLTYKKETDNAFDKNAVAVFWGNVKLGYIKRIHNKVFDLKRTLKLTVKAIDQNGIIKQIFVKVEK